MANAGLFLIDFYLFKETLQFCNIYLYVKNVHPVYHAGIRTLHESPPITTRPGLVITFLLYSSDLIFKFCFDESNYYQVDSRKWDFRHRWSMFEAKLYLKRNSDWLVIRPVKKTVWSLFQHIWQMVWTNQINFIFALGNGVNTIASATLQNIYNLTLIFF